MSLNRVVRANGAIALASGVSINIDYEYSNQAPAEIRWNVSYSANNINAMVNGVFRNGKIDNYTVSQGIVPEALITEIQAELIEVQASYDTI